MGKKIEIIINNKEPNRKWQEITFNCGIGKFGKGKQTDAKLNAHINYCFS